MDVRLLCHLVNAALHAAVAAALWLAAAPQAPALAWPLRVALQWRWATAAPAACAALELLVAGAWLAPSPPHTDWLFASCTLAHLSALAAALLGPGARSGSALVLAAACSAAAGALWLHTPAAAGAGTARRIWAAAPAPCYAVGFASAQRAALRETWRWLRPSVPGDYSVLAPEPSLVL